MKYCTKILFLFLMPVLAPGQQKTVNSMQRALNNARTDSDRYFISTRLSGYYVEINRDSALFYNTKALLLARKNDQVLKEALALDVRGYIQMQMGQFAASLACFQQAFKLAGNPESENKNWKLNYLKNENYYATNDRLDILASTHHDFGHLMGATNNIERQLDQYKETKKIALQGNDKVLLGLVNMNIGGVYNKINRLDSAIILEKSAEQTFIENNDERYLSNVYRQLGSIYLKKGNDDLAIRYFHKGVASGFQDINLAQAGLCYLDLTKIFLTEKQKDSSLYFAKKTLSVAHSLNAGTLGDAYENLYKSYLLFNKTDSAYKYQALALKCKDSSYAVTVKNLGEFQRLSIKELLHSQELEKEKETIQTRITTVVLLATIGVLLLLAGIFYHNNREKQKANILLNQQKEEVQNTFFQLQSTQKQLIQSEKMASLGELTAGIAHEIQNPLNFVNNFSEISVELLAELREEEQNGNKEEVIAIANDLTQNLEKINHHGKRADAIVKGMLEHSRAGSGVKELTDINKLADEYLRLAYHGLRAKDKSFNAELVTNFDQELPQVNVIPQDIGRVLLNLFNNAFYAVNQKAKTAGADYKPEVSVTTYHENGNVIIVVKDNGVGIPNAIKDKIMQPFFTTKPTGEGTGLGLSLTYDMIVKGHGGSIATDTKEGEFTIFTVSLPIS